MKINSIITDYFFKKIAGSFPSKQREKKQIKHRKQEEYKRIRNRTVAENVKQDGRSKVSSTWRSSSVLDTCSYNLKSIAM